MNSSVRSHKPFTRAVFRKGFGGGVLLLFAALFSAHQWKQNQLETEADAFRQEFLQAWQRSEEYTLTIAGQMPES
ncbi:MAG: hypothetical protein MUD08_11915, partial [Cytophagales bacterium]|nr:hypothetical protein [Cytophagales bacterium]